MFRYFTILMALFAALSSPAFAQGEKTIHIVADEWCPFNCDPESEKPGYVVEIAKEIFSPYGIQINYEIVPWTRAVQGTEDGIYDGIIGVAKSESSKLTFPSEISGISLYKFYVKKNSEWNYKDESSLNDVILGVIKDYGYGSLDKYITENQNNNTKVQILSSDDAAELNIKKLAAGRITTTYGDEFVTDYIISKLGLNNKIRKAGEISKTAIPDEDYIYLAFSPKNPKSGYYSKIYSEGIKELRKSGKLDKIMNKYGLHDWQVQP